MTTYTPPVADMGFVMAEVAGGDISAIIANIFFANPPVELMEEAGWLAIPLFLPTDSHARARVGCGLAPWPPWPRGVPPLARPGAFS